MKTNEFMQAYYKREESNDFDILTLVRYIKLGYIVCH